LLKENIPVDESRQEDIPVADLIQENLANDAAIQEIIPIATLL
jgi:hypothetical protein